MFEDAIRYPWTGEKHVETIAIGGVLSVLGVLVVPTFLVYGYLVRVIRRVADGDDEVAPAFDDWWELFVDGVQAFVVVLAYSLFATIVVGLAVLGLVLPATFSEGGGPASVNVLGLIVALVVAAVALVVAVGVAYLLPAAVAAFARTDRLTAAFSPGHLRSVGGHGGYAVGWAVALGVTVLAGIVGGVVSATVVGGLLVPFVKFYGSVAAAYAIGEGVSDVAVVEREDGATARDRSTV